MASDSNCSDLLAQFINVTGADNDRARFYLESSAWNLQVALESFYEEESDYDPHISPERESNQVTTSAGAPARFETEGDVAADLVDRGHGQSENRPSKQPSKFSTIFKYQNDSSDEEEGQAYYAGGSERSGQQILGPGKKSSDDFVADMFKAAKDHGAEVVDRDEDKDQGRQSLSSFRGTGYRLGANENDSEVVPSTSEPSQPTVVVLKMWKNGFSLNDEPLREYTSPGNQEFLDSIRRGEIPNELLRKARGGEVSLNMEDHRNEDLQAASAPLKAFMGQGYLLGSPAPRLSTEVGESSLSSEQCQKNEAEASSSLRVDESQPTTNVQIRLADGTRLVAKLNHTHTVGDLRRFIVLARPQYSSTMFSLITTFPSHELTEDLITLKDASLLNAVVVQRLL